MTDKQAEKPHISRAKRGGWKCVGAHIICYSSNVYEAWAGWAGVPVDRPYEPEKRSRREDA